MKQETLDSYEKAVNRVVDYINLHLHNNLDLPTLAEIANISEYHFHRIFKDIMGENVGEYIIRLRLEDIAMRLRMNPQSLEEIVANTSYQSKHAVSKAFKKHFGIPPSTFKKQEVSSHLADSEELQEATKLIPEIKTVTDKRVVYIRIIDSYGSPESYRNAWKQLGEFGVKSELLTENTEWIGISFDDPTITKPEKCRFYACFTVDKEVTPTGSFGVQEIKGGLYAIFRLKGSYSGLSQLYYNIYTCWLPVSNYNLRSGKSFEVYLNHPDRVSEDEILTEIYVPIERKRRWVLKST